MINDWYDRQPNLQRLVLLIDILKLVMMNIIFRPTLMFVAIAVVLFLVLLT